MSRSFCVSPAQDVAFMNFLDYAVVAIYLVGLLWMGFALRGQHSKQDYFLGGRSLGWKSLTLSVMATQLSAISFISAPAFVGLREGGGLQWLSYELGVPLAMILLMATVLPVLYRSGVVSIYDYLESRYGRSTRILLSVVFQFSRAFATGIMVYAVSIILQGTMGIEPWQAILVTGVITVLYSLQGGMKAVVYGDVVQMVIILLGTAVCLGYGLYYLGGFDAFVAQVDGNRLQAINLDSWGFSGDSFGFWPMLFGGIVLYASYYGCDQTQAQRALSAKDDTQLKHILLANGLGRFPITLMYCFSGLVIGTLALSDGGFAAQLPESNPDWMMPIFILNYLPHGIIGLLVVAILAAAMSSLSSTINSLAAVSLEDYCRLTNKEIDNTAYLNYAKYIGFFWGAVTLLLSFYADDIAPTVIEAINKVGSVSYGPIFALFLLAALDKRLQAKHINIGLLSGVAVNIYLWLDVPEIFWFWWNFIGLVVTTVVAYLSLAVTPTATQTDSETPTHDLVSLKKTALLGGTDIVLLLANFALIIVICLLIPFLFT